MFRRYNRLIAIFIIIALSLYVVILNRDPLTIRFGTDTSITTASGVVLIGVFCLGILSTATVALYFGMKAWLREKSLISHDKQRQFFLDTILKARGFFSADEFLKAHHLWQQVLKREPANTIALVEQSRCLEQQGLLRDAAKLVDSARAAEPANLEVLFRSAELNLALDNKTAAIDNLALILYNHPTKKAAALARDLSEELGRFEDALEYHRQLEEMTGFDDSYAAIKTNLRFKKLLRDGGTDTLGLKEGLEKFVKDNRDYPPALLKLAALRREAGDIEEAIELMVKAASIDCNLPILRDVMNLWLSLQRPEKALAAGKIAIKDSHGKEKASATLDLIWLHLQLHMNADAWSLIENFPTLLRDEGIAEDYQLLSRFLILKGLYFSNNGNIKEASDIWNRLAESSISLSAQKLPREGKGSKAPSPTLFTT